MLVDLVGCESVIVCSEKIVLIEHIVTEVSGVPETGML